MPYACNQVRLSVSTNYCPLIEYTMKHLLLAGLLSLMAMACSTTETSAPDPVGNDVITPAPSIHGTWNLTNVSGGLAGIDEDFGPGQVVWSFDVELSTLTVDNTNSSGSDYTGIGTGEHDYNLLKQNNTNYLLVRDREVGRMRIVEGELIIDGNDRSDGSGADFYVFTFSR